jgi:hypothetical protein
MATVAFKERISFFESFMLQILASFRILQAARRTEAAHALRNLANPAARIGSGLSPSAQNMVFTFGP